MSLAKRILLILALSLLILWWHQPAIAPTPSFSPPHEGEIERGSQRLPVTSLLAVGDIMLSRNVSTKIERANDPNLPFQNLKELLAAADLTFGNLECPLDEGEVRIREGLIFRCLTKDFEGVIAAGFDVLSTANNHALDQGLDNLEFTIDYLKSRNILPVGTTSSLSPPHEGEMKEGVIERNGIKFGFLSYSYSARNDGGRSTHPQIATMHDPSILHSAISNLQLRGADVIIVSMHAGFEYVRTPNQAQIDFARAAIDAGADIVLGHHPHWIQPIEVYHPLLPEEGCPPQADGVVRECPKPRTGLIFYSLGNFIFDQMWSQETREGLLVELKFEGVKLKTVKLIPIIIDNYCCPRLADEKEKTKILEKISLDSDLIQFEF